MWRYLVHVFFWVFATIPIQSSTMFPPDVIESGYPGYRLKTTNPFQLRHKSILFGDFKATGANIIREVNYDGDDLGDQNGTLFENCVNGGKGYTDYIQVDPNIPLNSSSATLELPSDITGSDIVWAGLYWQGFLQDPEANNTITKLDNSQREEIVLKTPDGVIHHLVADDLWYYEYWGEELDGNLTGTGQNLPYTPGKQAKFNKKGYRSFYQGFVEVTDLVRNSYAPNRQTFTVGNFKNYRGCDFYSYYKSPSFTHDQVWTDTFGAWSLVVVYRHSDPDIIAQQNPKIVTIYDGFDYISPDFNGESVTMDVNVSGFLTPRSGEVNAKMLFFGHGVAPDPDNDREYQKLQIQDKTTSNYASLYNRINPLGKIFNASFSYLGRAEGNAWNKFNLDTYDVSNYMTNNQTQTSLKLFIQSKGNLGGDVFPAVFGFSTDLYRPRICYDYTIRKDGVVLESQNRQARIFQPGRISYNVSIRSQEADFDLQNVKLKLIPSPVNDMSFVQALYSPNPINTLIPAITTPLHNPPREPQIAIGGNATPNGGTISAQERYYTSFVYDITRGNIITSFDIELNATIDLGFGPVPYLANTRYGGIPRCDQNLIYNPSWGMFNVERVDSGDFDPISQPAERFSLYTQVAGKDFDFSLVAYDANGTTPYVQPLSMPQDLSVEVELIDARSFDDNASYLKCHNPNPAIIQKSFFLTIPAGSSRVDWQENDDLAIDTALRNAAFRIWVLKDENATVIFHNCANKNDDGCFAQVYDRYFKTRDARGFCQNACGTSPSGCYQCLRDYLAEPICSRDNFAIRPKNLSLALYDNNESDDLTSSRLLLATNKNYDGQRDRLIAGYGYQLDINATRYGDRSGAHVKGYSQAFTIEGDDLQARFLFDSATGSRCYDTNHTAFHAYFEDGVLYAIDKNRNGIIETEDKARLIQGKNVGYYTLHFEDRNWTIVDQARNPNKTFPGVDDCIVGSNRIAVDKREKSGCYFGSEYLQDVNTPYRDLLLHFYPYAFVFEDLNVSTSLTNANAVFDTFMYMNDLLQDSRFAMVVSGTLRAVAKGDQNQPLTTYPTTTNFSDGCAANDLTVSLRYGTVPSTVTQRNLQWYVKDVNQAVDINQSALALNGTDLFEKSLFKDGNESGSAAFEIYTNIKRPGWDRAQADISLLNPIKVTYQDLNATATSISAQAFMGNRYTPHSYDTGDINQSKIFYYAKADIHEPYTNSPVISYDENETIGFGVWVFCQNPVDTNVTCADVGLRGSVYPMFGAGAGWYKVTDHDGSLGMGTISQLTVAPSGALTINPSQLPYYLDDDGGSTVQIYYPSAAQRPRVFTLEYKADPWLDIDKKLQIHFYREGFQWKGEGKTGHVIDDGATKKVYHKRIGW